jgi:hypothetical protein
MARAAEVAPNTPAITTTLEDLQAASSRDTCLASQRSRPAGVRTPRASRRTDCRGLGGRSRWLRRITRPAAKKATSSKRGQPARRRVGLLSQRLAGTRGGVIARVLRSRRQKLNRPLRSMWVLTSEAAPYYYHESLGCDHGGCCWPCKSCQRRNQDEASSPRVNVETIGGGSLARARACSAVAHTRRASW